MARIFLSRRSLGEGGCSMKITEDVRKYAAVYRAVARQRRKQGIAEETALKVGMEQKAAEFVEKGSEVYAKA